MPRTDSVLLGTKRGLWFGDLGSTWKPTRHVLKEHSITSIVTGSEGLIVGTTHGVYVSETGEHWYRGVDGLDHLKVRSLARHPREADLLLAGTEPAAIYASRDGGHTWTKGNNVAAIRDRFGWFLPYSPEAGCVRGFAFQENTIYAAAEEGGVLYSTSGGADWDLVPGSSGIPDTSRVKAGQVHPDVHSVHVPPNDPQAVWATTGGGLFFSNNRGDTWENRYPCYCRELWIDPVDPTHLMFGPAEGVDRNGRILGSTDGAMNWQEMPSDILQPFPHTMIELMVSHEELVLAVLSDGRLMRSERQKNAWQVLQNVDDVQTAAFL